MLLAIEDIKHVFASLKAKGAFAILSGAFLTKVAAFLGSLILVRIMSKSEFGVLGYMENLYTYACLFAGYGLNNAVYRYLVLKESRKKGNFRLRCFARDEVQHSLCCRSFLAGFSVSPFGRVFDGPSAPSPHVACSSTSVLVRHMLFFSQRFVPESGFCFYGCSDRCVSLGCESGRGNVVRFGGRRGFVADCILRRRVRSSSVLSKQHFLQRSRNRSRKRRAARNSIVLAPVHGYQ